MFESHSSFIVDGTIKRGIPKSQLPKLSLDDVWAAARATSHDDLANKSWRSFHRQGVDPNYHVFLPFYMKHNADDRWRSIEKALRDVVAGQIRSGENLKSIILRYNGANEYKWDFRGLIQYFDELTDGKFEEISETLVEMARLALDIKNIIHQSIPFLKQGQERSISLSQKQIACLLAHAFFCTFPMRKTDADDRDVDGGLPLPSINFKGLFCLEDEPIVMTNKLHCIFHYFKRVTTNVPSGVVVFKRQSLRRRRPIDWMKSSTRFKQLHVMSSGCIEDEDGLLQVDFANKYVGGGVFVGGCVQEEIRFLISTELIVSRLFTEVLEKDEVLVVTGCETFCKYSGYSDSFEFKGDFNDVTESKDGLKLTQVVAMDALNFSDGDIDQFDDRPLIHELNKAYCGFLSDHQPRGAALPAVATGNWGCGAFDGDLHLKSLIQLMAAAEAGRDICYNTYGDKELVEKIFDVHKLITDHNLSVSEVYNMIIKYRERKGSRHEQLYDYILRTFPMCWDDLDGPSDDP